MNNYGFLDISDSSKEKQALNSIIPNSFIKNIKIKQIYHKDTLMDAYFITYLNLEKECPDIRVLANFIQKTFSNLKINAFLIFDIPIEKIIYLVGLYDIYAYYIHICRIPIYSPPKVLIRKHKKADHIFIFVYGNSAKPFLKEALQLSKKADYFIKNDINEKMIDILNNYFELNNKYVIVALDSIHKNPSGIICGNQEENETVKMICHFYDPTYCRNYVNNGLYYHFIELCKQNDVNVISYGTTDIHDNGLNKFKEYYSTEKTTLYSAIINLGKNK